MALSDVQQHLLSYFKLVGVSSLENATKAYKQIFNNDVGAENLPEQISAINLMIKQFDFEIVECIDELTSEKLFILVNTVYDEITQKAKFYDKNVTQFFSEIIKNCILSERGHISEISCLNLSTHIGLTKTLAQNSMEGFIKEKWLDSVNGNISLGMRTIAELQQSIKQIYPDKINYCPLCKLIIFQGYFCENCNARYHFACLNKYNASTRKQFSCLECREVWKNTPLQNLEESNGLSSSPVPAKIKKTTRS